MALPTTYLSRRVVWDSFLLFWVYRSEWLCCWFISTQFIQYLFIISSLDSLVLNVRRAWYAASCWGKQMRRQDRRRRGPGQRDPHSARCAARLGRSLGCCVEPPSPDEPSLWREVLKRVVGQSGWTSGRKPRLRMISEAYSGGEGDEAASEKRACQDPGARQYSSSLEN